MLIAVSTAYLKISIVLGMVRSALGAQQVPNNMIVMALSTCLTFFVMAPVFSAVSEKASALNLAQLEKLSVGQLGQQFAPIIEPWSMFLKKHSGDREIASVREMDQARRAEAPIVEAETVNQSDNLNLRILLPAFMLTELKEAFSMAFVVLLPFLVIDLIVANVLVGMGMSMLSPPLISLPLKLLLFVLSDAWMLLVRGLVFSYGA